MELIIRPTRAIALTVLLTGLILGIARPAPANVVYVNKNATGPVHDGTSWATAFKTIGAGISIASNGDEVWVASGTYFEQVKITSSIMVYGGFAGTETGPIQRDAKRNPTTIEANSGDIYPITASSPISDVLIDGVSFDKGPYGIRASVHTLSVVNCTFTTITTYGIRLDAGSAAISDNTFNQGQFGVTVTSGTANISNNTFTANNIRIIGGTAAVTNNGIFGGGVYVNKGAATVEGNSMSRSNGVKIDGHGSATVTNNLIAGGVDGVNVLSGTATVASNRISNNSGHGILVGSSGTATISNNTVSGNTFGVTVSSTSTIANNAIAGNRTGVEVTAGTATLINNTLSGNDSGLVVSGGTASLTNNILAFSDGYGVSLSAKGGITAFSHNDVFSNAAGDFSGYTPPSDHGNVFVDPKVSNIYHDVHIQPDSPCIDAGDDSAIVGNTDIDGQPRIQGAHVDIGSDESDGTVWSVPQVILHVTASGNDSNDGRTWVSAKRTVMAALAAAEVADEVWVARGTYHVKYGNGAIPPARVALYGGFAGSETSRSQRDWKTNVTALDAGISLADLVTCQFQHIVVDGFTIRNGHAGVSVASSGSATISNNTICGNYQGVSVDHTAATVSHNTISANYSFGLAASGMVSVDGNLICGNGLGAGASGNVTIANSTIAGNNNDGVDTSASGTVLLTNCTITGNGGSGVKVSGGTTLLSNTIVAFNEGSGLYAGAGGVVTLSHNDVYGNKGGDYYGLTPPTGGGNISLDPKLSSIYRNTHIQPGSPCVDAGDDAAVIGNTDIDGQPRTQGLHVDIGSDESDGTVWADVPATIRVSPTGDDSNKGESWATAKRTVTAALSAAQPEDEIWVAEGDYPETVLIPSRVSLYGGFAGTETERTQRDWTKRLSVLDATGVGNNVITCQFQNAVIDGFVLRNGYRGAYVSAPTTLSNNTVSGSLREGIYCSATLTLSNSIVIESGGDGVHAGAQATVMGNTISGNDGIGLSIGSFGNSAVFGNAISGNAGDGLDIGAGAITVSDNTVSGNNGYGVNILSSASAVLANNTVCENGGGVNAGNTAGLSLFNNIVAFNDGYGVYGSGVILAVAHNDVFGNSVGDYYGYWPSPGQGNISVDPQLSNRYHDIHLRLGSPCIDAGDDSAVTAGETDLYGNPRTFGPHVDIGSDESNGTVWASSSRVWFVAQSGSDTADGLTWSTAKRSVTGALWEAQSGDQVWVAKGVYTESISPAAGLAIYGGFAGSETELGQRDWKANETVLNGMGSPRSTDIITCRFRNVVVDGFTIHNGSNGVDVPSGEATISNNTFSATGVAVLVNGGGATISNNSMSGDNVGVFLNRGSAAVANCVLSGSYFGIYVANGAATITNNTVVGSSSYGVWVDWGTATLSNNIIAFNGDDGVEAGDWNSILTLNDVYGNATKNYGYTTTLAGSNGNISADPMFVNQSNGDYHLQLASPCRDAGDDSAVTPGETDLDGNPRIYSAHVDMGAYELQQAPVPWSVSLGTTVTGGVTVAEKVAYVGGDDGKLYARSTEDGSAVAGFPLDISAAVGATVKLPSRPAVYYGKTGKAIYLTTDRGDVVRILPDGEVGWHVRPLTGETVSTPAVTPDGNVYVNLSTGSGPFDNFVFKLDEATGTPISLSPFLGYTTADDIGDFSPAANDRYLYVNAGWGSKSGLTLLNQDNLAVRSSFAGGEQCLPPLLLGSDLLLASKIGKAWKMNAVTLAPDLGFGHFGVADLGTQITAAPFSDAAGNVYIGTADGRILKWAPGSGAFQPFYTASGKIAGLTIDRTAGVLGFGTSSGSFVQVPLGDPTSASTVTPGGPISTGTVYDSLTDRFIVVTDSGVLSGYPSVR